MARFGDFPCHQARLVEEILEGRGLEVAAIEAPVLSIYAVGPYCSSTNFAVVNTSDLPPVVRVAVVCPKIRGLCESDLTLIREMIYGIMPSTAP
jgi:hypothetical protein